MTKTYNLTITELQAQAIAHACDLLSRVQIGQWREIVDWLPLQKPIDYDELHQDTKVIGDILSKHMIDNINGCASSLGIGHPDLPKNNGVLYDLYKVITRELSMERLISEGKIPHKNVSRNQLPITVNYDEIHRWGDEPLAEIQKVTSPSQKEGGWSLVRYTYDGDHKVYETLFKGAQNECSSYAFDHFTDDIGMCLLDSQGREWNL